MVFLSFEFGFGLQRRRKRERVFFLFEQLAQEKKKTHSLSLFFIFSFSPPYPNPKNPKTFSPGDHEGVGTVGPPLPSVGLRLEAVPEMGCDPFADPPRGEVCISGPTVFSGYYRDAEKTKEVLEEGGLFHTGDIGELTPQGMLKIVDRKKNIFKLSQGELRGVDSFFVLNVLFFCFSLFFHFLLFSLSFFAFFFPSLILSFPPPNNKKNPKKTTGEYIAVEKIEAVYKKCPLVEQVWAYGNSFESALVAVVVPAEAALRSSLAAAGVTSDADASTPLAELCARPEVNKHVLAALTATGKDAKLKGFEAVKALHLDDRHFSVEDDTLTPTFKLKRPQLLKRYQAKVDELYAKLKK